MRSFALATARNITLTVVCAAFGALATRTAPAQEDPPDQAGRVSYLSGTVSIQTSGSDDWGQAYPNLPIGPGDRIFTDQNGQAEIQVGQSYIRIGPNTDITLVDDDASLIAFGVAQGSVHIHSFGFWQGQSLDVSSPNGDARLGQSGELRADVWPDQDATAFTSFGNGIVISGAGGFWQQLGDGQSLQLAGTNPVQPQWLQPNGPDYLDQFSQQRDQQIMRAASYRYVSPEVPGAADLDSYGDWTPDSDYGPIWFPRDVAADWQPYHYGHWVNRDPWGWVWVEDESWGYAPFHYGRWVSYRGRWGWIPGPREDHPVWSPALVVFAGGIRIGDAGVSAWFPLGPGEPYRPWYRCSDRYIDRVNITNIHEGRNVRVQNTYVNVRNVTNITYVNRTSGVTAMRQQDFAAGRSARRASVDVDRRQFDRVQVVDTPAPVTRQSIVSRPVARPVPVSGTHPTFINQQGMQISARPGVRPQAPPVRQIERVQAPPGRTVVAPPQNARYQNPNGNLRTPDNQPGRSMQPNDGRQGNYPNQQPVNANGQQQNNNQQQRGPVAPGVQPTGRPMMPTQGQRENYPNQQNNNQQPNGPVAPGVQPTGRPIMPPQGQREGYPNQQNNNQQQRGPVAPGVQPTGRPVMPPQGQQEGSPNPQNNNQQPRGPVAPGVQPTGRPVMPPQGQQEGSPNPQNNNQQPRGPVAPGVQPTGRPNMPPPGQPPNNPNQQNNRPNNQPQQPSDRPTNNRQDFGPTQPDRHNRDQAQPNQPPAYTPPPQQQNRRDASPPPQQDNRNADKFQIRQQPPPQQPPQQQNRRDAGPPPPQQNRRDAGPPPQQRNDNKGGNQNKDDRKDQKKDDKKDHN